MREIKFRAWDSHERCFIPADKIRKVVLWGLSAGVAGELRGADSIDLSLCTGKKDTKGQEIYDGDIIDYGGKLFVVEYEDAEYQLIGETDSYSLGYSHNIRVVGNIYDNPDLLKAGGTS